MPQFSVCIAAFSATYLGDALQSVLAQSVEDFEVLVGDDSGGALRPLVEEIGDRRIRYIRNDERRRYAGNTMNLISLATGDYISLLQHDDVLEPDFLASALRVLSTDPTVGVVITGSNDITSDGRLIEQRPTRLTEGVMEDPVSELLEPSCMVFLPSATVLRRQAILRDMKPWPDNGIADLAMYIDLATAGWRFHYLARPLIGYRMHDAQLSALSMEHRGSIIDLWSGYAFANPLQERKRVRMVAQAHLARAGAHVRRQDGSAARQDLASARKLLPSVGGWKWRALYAMSHATALTPLAALAWKRIRNPVTNRFKGF